MAKVMEKVKTKIKQIKERISKFVIVMASKFKDFTAKFKKPEVGSDSTKSEAETNNQQPQPKADLPLAEITNNQPTKKEREVVKFLKKHKQVKPTKDMLSSLDQAVFEVTKIDKIKQSAWLKFDFKGLFANIYFKYSVAVFSSLFVFLLGLSILGLPIWLFLRNFWVNVTTNPVYAPIEVVATASTSYGIPNDSSFVIRVKDDIDVSVLANNITIFPEIDFEVELNGSEILVIPSEELDNDTIYTITIPKDTQLSSDTRLAVELSFVFVTEPGFMITGTTPRDGVLGPADTALEIEFSYNNVVLDSFTQRFYVSPERAGSFLQIDNKIAFVPTEPLVPGVTYTFGVTDGVETADGRVLSSGVESTFVATYPQNYDVKVGYFSPQSCITQGDDIVTTIADFSTCSFYDSGSTKRDITAKVFSISKEQLIQGVIEFPSAKPDFVDGLTPTWSATVNSDSYGKYTLNPGITTAGIYMLELSMSFPTGETSYNYQYVVVSDLSASWQTYNISNAIWVTNAGGQAVVSGATVEAYGQDGSKINELLTDSNGLATFDGENSALIIATVNGKHVTIVPFKYGYQLSGWYDDSYVYRNDLLTSVVLDRPYYSYGDKVQFKGIVRDKNTLLTVPSNINTVLVFVIDQSYNFGRKDAKIITKVNVPFDTEMGTFSGEFYLPSNLSGSAYIMFKVGDSVIASQRMEITELEDVAEVEVEVSTTSKIFSHRSSVDVFIDGYYANGSPILSETVDVNVSISRAMFYGIPEESLSEAYLDSGYSSQSYVISGVNIDQGRAVVTVDTSACVDLCEVSVNVKPKEEYSYSGSWYTSFVVNNVDTYLVVDSVKNIYGTGEAFTVNISGVTLWSGTKVPGILVTGTLQHTWYEPYTVNEYNPETKRIEPVTKYERNSETSWSGTGTTDSNGNLVFNIPNSGEGSYDLNLSFTAPGGNPISLPSPESWSVSGSATVDLGYIQANFDKDSYVPGETAVISIVGASQGYAYLQIQSSENKVDYVINLANSNLISYTIPQSGVGRVSAYVHYQQDINLWCTGYDYAVIDRSDKKLNISIDNISESYSPGQEVSFTVSVTDSSGNPVNGEVVVNVFDSRLGDSESDFDLFEDFYGQYVSMFTSEYSYSLPYSPGYGAGGGAGGGYVRSDFKRLAYWNSTITVENGKATVTFKLPDTITSWNAYVVGYTKDSKFGYGKETIVSSQNVYVSVPELQFIREGDTVTLPVSVRNYTNSSVSGNLAVTSTGCQVVKGASTNITLSAFGGSKVDVSLTPSGSTDCIVTYSFNKGLTLLDGMELTYDIFPDDQLAFASELVTVPAGGTVTATIDYTKLEYINSLLISNAANDLYNADISFDIDTVSTQEVAALILAESLKEDRDGERLTFAQTVLANNVTLEGCFGWFSYDACDIEATIYGYIALNQLSEWGYDVADISIVEAYLENILQNTAVDNKYKVMAIWGLSFSQNRRALAAAINLVSDGLELTDLSYGYLLYALNNFGATGQGIGIANRLVGNATKSEQMSWWTDSDSISAGSDNDRYVTSVISLALKPYVGDITIDKTYKAAVYYVQNTTYRDSKNVKNFFIVLASGVTESTSEPLNVSVVVNDQPFDWDLNYDTAIVPEELLVSGENHVSITNNGTVPAVLKLEYYEPVISFAVNLPSSQEIFNLTTGSLVSRNRINVGDTIVVRTLVDPVNDSGNLIGSALVPTGYKAGYAYNVNWETYKSYLDQLPDTVNFMYSSNLTPRYVEYAGWYNEDTSKLVIDQILTCHFAGSTTVGETFIALEGDRSVGVLLPGVEITCVE